MRNLLELETSILAQNETLRNGLKLNEIHEHQNEIFTSGVSKFNSSVKMSKIVKKSMEFFNSEECKNVLFEEGISWTKEEFFMKLFGWKRAYGYKMLKLATIHSAKIRGFVNTMQSLRERGEDTQESSISVENCLKYVRERENGEDTTEQRVVDVTFLKVAFTFEGVKKSLTMKQSGAIKTDMSGSELEQVREHIANVIVNNNL
tara:strand:+ start:19625 stop:20236 length:612 start_codon:yes stop_codon:yes gene_type:complete